ncbi:hypothetical protein V5799_034137 [Amblyomma americanum]|uniref:Secreted protein n=1 Tax=Amblyomma americanum TaxID=6943 RepID=A0AAQ4DLB0_AMBAM
MGFFPKLVCVLCIVSTHGDLTSPKVTVHVRSYYDHKLKEILKQEKTSVDYVRHLIAMCSSADATSRSDSNSTAAAAEEYAVHARDTLRHCTGDKVREQPEISVTSNGQGLPAGCRAVHPLMSAAATHWQDI